MKTKLFFNSLLITICFFIKANAQNFTSNNFSYTVQFGVNEVYLSAYTGSQIGLLTIPEIVVYSGTTYKVTGTYAPVSGSFSGVFVSSNLKDLASSAFSNRGLTGLVFKSNSSLETISETAFFSNDLENISLPNSIKTIGLEAFGYNDLTSVAFGNSLVTIGDGAFENNDLESITFPSSLKTIGNNTFINNKFVNLFTGNSVTTIGNNAFKNNELSTVIIGNSVTSIGAGAFSGNPSIKRVEARNTNAATLPSDAFDDRANINLIVPAGQLTNYENAGWTGFKSIHEDNFVIINSGTTTIAQDAYRNQAITGVSINSSVVTIGDGAFQDNEIFEVSIPNNVTTIEGTAFERNNIDDLTLGNSVATIGNYAFGQNELTEVVFPNSLTTISLRAFQRNNLTEVIFPNALTSIGDHSFRENKLTKVFVSNSVESILTAAFEKNVIDDLTLGSNLTTIGNYAFNENNLTEVVIPENVDTIGVSAFTNNPLTTVESKSTSPATLPSNAFSNTESIDLIIPVGSYDAYIAAGWTGFKTYQDTSGLNLSINNVELLKEITITESNDVITVSSINIKIENLTLYSISGTKILYNKGKSISLGILNSGIYILKLETNKGVVSKKIIRK